MLPLDGRVVWVFPLFHIPIFLGGCFDSDQFDFGHPSADGIADLAGEKIHVVPTERFRNGSRIVVRDSFEVRLDEHGTATVTVPPTTARSHMR